MTDLVQASSETTVSWSSSPLIVSRDFFSHQTWARFQTGGARPVYSDVTIYKFWYIIFMTYAVCVSIFITSPLGVAVGFFVSIRKFIYKILKSVSFWLHGCCGEWKGSARKPVNHTSWVAVDTPTDCPRAIRNCCIIESFFWRCCFLTLSLLTIMLVYGLLT